MGRSLLLGFQYFLLERVGFGEVEADLVGGDLVIDLSHGVKLVLNLLSVEGIEGDLDVLLAVESHSGAFASDGCRVDLLNIISSLSIIINNTYDIFQSCCVDCSEGSASGSLLSSVSYSYKHRLLG